MMFLTAKVNWKLLGIIAIAVIGVVIALILLLSGGAQETAAPALSGNEARVKFLEEKGWQVSDSPTHSGQVRIPEEASQVFDRYNALQKSQGYDLQAYAGKAVMRYVYKVENYPGATEPVYATLLVYQDQVIGGDVTDTSSTGVIRSFRFPEVSVPSEPESSATTQPSQ